MGNKFLIVAVVVTALFSKTDYAQIDALIEKIKVKREGLSQTQIAKLKNPFVDEKIIKKIIQKTKKQKKQKKAKSKRLVLQSIFNNRAKINGRWYKVGSKVWGYKIAKIDPLSGTVVLVKNRKTLTLFLKNRKKRSRIQLLLR